MPWETVKEYEKRHQIVQAVLEVDAFGSILILPSIGSAEIRMTCMISPLMHSSCHTEGAHR